jgi:hypothetical protein
MIRIRLLSAPKPAFYDPRVDFDPAYSLDECDGLLVWGAMSQEFLDYRGVRAWFIDEPLTQGMFRTPPFRQALREIAPHEFLHHSNHDPKYRFPCAAYYGKLTLAHCEQRKDLAIAVVSNFGGRYWRIRDSVMALTSLGPCEYWLYHGLRLRNEFILHGGVELFGSSASWKCFRQWPWSRPGPPKNYCGPHEGWWISQGHIEKLAKYRLAVCIENASLPYYFTEKLVNAVRAGCIPIYHAHPTVRQTYLEGATWIDPADHDFNVKATFDAANNTRLKDAEIREQNWKWLESDQVKQIDGFRIWSRIADYFVERIGGNRNPANGLEEVA